MIVLHRLAHEDEPFYLNPDLIVTVEATPDTVISLTTGTKIVVVEPPEEVSELVLRARQRYAGRCAFAAPIPTPATGSRFVLHRRTC